MRGLCIDRLLLYSCIVNNPNLELLAGRVYQDAIILEHSRLSSCTTTDLKRLLSQVFNEYQQVQRGFTCLLLHLLPSGTYEALLGWPVFCQKGY